MRLTPVFLLLGLAGLTAAQTGSAPQTPDSLFSTMVPDATISIKKHPLGPDMVDITMKAAGYPIKLLESQIQNLQKFMHSAPRGVQVYDYVLNPSDPNSHFTRGQFVVDGALNRELGSVRLKPFAQALAGAPKPWTVNSIEFQLEGETPTDKMIRAFRSKAAIVEGRVEDSKDPRVAGIEFRVRLLTQTPEEIDIPEPGDAPLKSQNKPASPPGRDWTTIVVFLVAAGAVGALVYSLLLRARPMSRN